MNKRIIVILFFIVGIMGFISQIQADPCGDTNGDGVTDTPCNCGDTVVGAPGYTYQLTSDLNCDGEKVLILQANLTLEADITTTGPQGLYVDGEDITIDGNNHTLTGGGAGEDFESSGINNAAGNSGLTIQNFAGISNFNMGICEYADSSIIGNTISFNTFGMYGSITGSITNNTIKSNTHGIYYTESGAVVSGNNLLNNQFDIYHEGEEGDDVSTYSSNQSNNNLTSKMILFDEITRNVSVNDSISFTITAREPDSSACPDCTVVITTTPSEPSLTYNNNEGAVTGSFTPTRLGIYSLNITVTDSNSNTTKRRIAFFVGDMDSTETKYYFRGTHPTHGQPMRMPDDAATLLFTAPTATEEWFCGGWIQNSPDVKYPIIP
jgi:parallel beta-helix repeat protein